MEWEILKKKGRPTDEQIDSVGNIYQKSGGVIPHACQKCKSEFKSEIQTFDITQDVRLYTCEDCKFESNTGDTALMHKIDKADHNLKIKTRKRIVGAEKKIVGLIPKITKTQNDIIILCSNCSDY